MVDYKTLANEARKEILTLVHKAQTSHIASNFSVIDIATVLYENLQPEDRVVWSKGWAAASIYYFLWKQGKITREQLESFPNEPFLGLAETTVPGVEVNGGSVGHGLSVAVGMALGKKRASEKGTVYCIMSDGELNEGSVWEAAMMATYHKLDNLVAIIDANGWQAMGRTSDVIDVSPVDAFRGFGWGTDLIDGHNFFAIEDSIKRKPYELLNLPYVIVAKTIKGKGVSFFEDHLLYHYKHVDASDYEKAMAELCQN
jgi:transketolase